MKKLIIYWGIIIFLLLGIVSADNYYVTSPTACPNSYQSQTCSGANKVCGYSGGITFCWNMSTLNAPAGSITTTGTGGTDYSCSDATCSGGLITDCYSYDGTAPYCDTGGLGICDRNATCYNKHVQTTCTGGSWITSSCSATCTTNYFACDGSTSDSNGCEIHAGDSCGVGTGTIVNNQCYSASAGNCTSSARLDCNNDDSDANPVTCNGNSDGCEILIGGTCTVGGLTGTYGSTCSGGVGICTVSKSYFQTGTNVEYITNSSQAFLWGKDYNFGTLLNLSWTSGGFLVNVTGAYFNGTLVAGGEPFWNNNYSTFLTHINWSQVMNGTLFKTSQWNATNTSYALFDTLNNGSYLNYPWNATNTSYMLISNWNATNTSYALDSILNNGSYFNYPWNSTNISYYLVSNPFDFYNSTTFPDYYLMNTGDYAIGNYVFDTNTLFVDADNHRIGIGTINPNNKLNVIGDINFTGLIYGNGSQLIGLNLLEIDPKWSANYSDFLTKINWSQVMNGTLFKTSQWNATNTSINWVSLTNYPVACPAGTYVTRIDDSITCTTISDIYLLNSGDIATGNYYFSSDYMILSDATGQEGITFNPSLGAVQQIYTDRFGGGTERDLVLGTFTNKANQLYLKTDGNVGIGTTSPTTKFQIGNYNEQNTLKITGHSEDNKAPVLSFYREGIRESFIAQGKAPDVLIFGNTGGEIADSYTDANLLSYADMVINSAGNVGIGTTNPEEKLEVSGNIKQTWNDGYFGWNYTSGGTYKTGMRFVGQRTLDVFNIMDEASKIIFTTGTGASNGERMIITGGGNVGIGTTSPVYKLDTYGTVRIGTGAQSYEEATPLLLSKPANNDVYLNIWQEGVSQGFIGNKAGDTNLYITNGYNGAIGTAAYSITLTSSGNVGIGTTIPTAGKFVVSQTNPYGTPSNCIVAEGVLSGGSSSDPAYYGSILFKGVGYDWGKIATIQTNPYSSWTNRMAFYTMNGNGGALTERMAIDNSGNVGIGTTTPLSKLSVGGNGNTKYGIYGYSSVTSGVGIYGEAAGGAMIGVEGYGPYGIYGQGTDIGVYGYGTNYDFYGDGPKSYFAGKVGIGTFSPQQKLHVNGSILANGTINSTVDVCIPGGNCLSNALQTGVGMTDIVSFYDYSNNHWEVIIQNGLITSFEII